MSGKICHINIPSHSLSESQEFYGQLFGWQFMANAENYLLFDDGGIGGGFTTDSKPSTESGIVFFIEVEDIEATLLQVETAGGTAVLEKTAVGGPGFYGMFTDPHGNRIGLYSRT